MILTIVNFYERPHELSYDRSCDADDL